MKKYRLHDLRRLYLWYQIAKSQISNLESPYFLSRSRITCICMILGG